MKLFSLLAGSSPIPAAYRLRLLTADESGSALIEFAFALSAMMVVIFNGAEFAKYSFQRMEVENATQAAAQAAWKTCDTAHLPATVSPNCPGLTTALTNAIQSTSLGSGVTMQSGSPSENYYCVSTAGSLVSVGAVTATKPSDCSSVGSASDSPGDYIKISTTYNYTAMLSMPFLTIGSALPGTITSSSLMRLQ